MDDVGQVRLLPPPEDPQFLCVWLDLAAPHAQQVGADATHEAPQHRVVMGWRRDNWPVLAAATEAVASPLDACQLRLVWEGEWEPDLIRAANETGACIRVFLGTRLETNGTNGAE